MSTFDGKDIGLPKDFFNRHPRRGTPEEVAQAEKTLLAIEEEQALIRLEHERAETVLRLLEGGVTGEEARAIHNAAQIRLNNGLDALDRKAGVRPSPDWRLRRR